MRRNSVYVVFRGRKTGLFSSWPACHEQVDGFTGASYKKFNSRDEAYKALRTPFVYSCHSCPESSMNVAEKILESSHQCSIIITQAFSFFSLMTVSSTIATLSCITSKMTLIL
ncbi:hypothetical protein Ddye_015493 [Dipteronia dyeriana]|uniref:Ribonuclease H n=1 Tax=Dipteronia dyeriana TaxID=168575 RepID=A0AAD9U603_9ROSI|nr:hypothetical protein Ddye_015493 [Dipteronia dyeriana]